MKILILEDDERRAQSMLARLRDRFYTFEHHVFECSADMIRCLDLHLAEAIAISLDHDLSISRDEEGRLNDSGCGRDVADYLAEREPVCPVVIHSTNLDASLGMETALKDRGWAVERVTPYGDLEWIDEVWFPAIRQAILEAASRTEDQTPNFKY